MAEYSGLGKWIVIEGGDGYGKTEQVMLLKQALQREGIPVYKGSVREPGGTAVAEAVRELLENPEHQAELNPIAKVLAHNFARAVLVQSVIRTALQNGFTVISDRCWFSTVVYQGVAEQVDVNEILQICEFALCGLLPDKAFVLNISPEEARRRLINRNERLSVYDAKPMDFHQNIYSGYLDCAERYREFTELIDGERSIAEVAEEILQTTLKLY